MADQKKTMPKGGRKGGSVFPRIDLKQAFAYCKKLVSKTHTGPQEENIILPGVFGTATAKGKVRASALKQFGWLDGTPKAYKASDDAKATVAAPPSERKVHLEKALFKAKVFRSLHDTFINDTVSIPQLRQQASRLNVHPDSVEECIKNFVESAKFAGIVALEGESIKFLGKQMDAHAGVDKTEEENDGSADTMGLNDSGSEDIDQSSKSNVQEIGKNFSQDDAIRSNQNLSGKGKAQVEIKIDPSMDPEKLDKLLAVLKKYGQI